MKRQWGFPSVYRTDQFIESIHWRGRENKPPWPWLNFLRRLPLRGEEHLAEKFPATQPRTGAAAPGAQWNSSGKDRVHTPTLARRWVGRLYVLLSIQWPCHPSRLLPLLHNILTSLRQEPNSIYLAVHWKPLECFLLWQKDMMVSQFLLCLWNRENYYTARWKSQLIVSESSL